LAELDELRSRFQRIMWAPRGASPAPVRSAATRPFSAYVNEDVDQASAIAARLSELTRRHGGGTDGLDAALSQAEELIATEATRGLVQYALKLFVTHDPTANRFLQLGPLERRQPGAVRGLRELRSREPGEHDRHDRQSHDDLHDDKE
jgi:hypothetical protein